ncbi:MAG: hypothetical protein EAZ89_01585 [Bacteroidetes bacterium]|nr:MAG: hypothetical protein EAZ89_01585 [Bacteroidota bacterium]
MFALALMPMLPAQETQPRKEQIQAFRVAFLTRRMALTAKEAQVFWPVYDAYQAEQDRNEDEIKQKEQALRQAMLGQSDSEVEKLIDETMMLRRKQLDIAERYQKEFKRVLPIRKVALLYQAEKDFRRELLEEIRNRQEQRANGGAVRRP